MKKKLQNDYTGMLANTFGV